MWRRLRPKLWKGMVSGLAGGLAATFVMTQFQNVSKRWAEPRHEGGQSHPPGEQEPREEPATAKAAEKITEITTGRSLDRRRKTAASQAVHYGFGALSGMFYGALSEYKRGARTGRGTAFGAGLWTIADEIAVPALGLSKPPTQEPPSAHLYGLASHLVYGWTADAVSRGVRALL